MASQVGTARQGQAGVDSACRMGRRERARMGEGSHGGVVWSGLACHFYAIAGFSEKRSP